MRSVACVLRSGGDFNREYVERLRDGIPGWERLICLSDDESVSTIEGVEYFPLATNWPGWLAKLEVFRLRGHILYLDLDTVVTGPVGELFYECEDGVLRMIEDFYHPGMPASGVMGWNGDLSEIYAAFNSRLIPQYEKLSPNRGDCGWIVKQVPHHGFFPKRLTRSYKAGGDASAPVTCYHGKPRPHETGWAI